MIWELLGSDKRVEAALAQQSGKDYDIAPKELPPAAEAPAEDFRAAAEVSAMLRYRTPRA
ncbi:MAG: hypothetical protein ACK4PK_08780 [Alphaproteobacteria bacterium]